MFSIIMFSFFQASGQEIPQIIRSCVRIINLYGKDLNIYVVCCSLFKMQDHRQC